MLLICENDKDRFIKLLDILDFTYFGNVLSLTRIDDLFKKLADGEKGFKDKSKDSKDDTKEDAPAEKPIDDIKLIDTTAKKLAEAPE